MPTRRGGYRAAVLASAVALVAGVLLAVFADSGPPGPDGVVRAYFAALSHSDAPGALALADGSSGSHAFLASDVLRLQQQLAPLSSVRIDGVDGAGPVRTVRYSYVLGFPDGGRRVSGQVDVSRHGDTWRLAAPAVAVHLDMSAASSRATLAGAALPDEPVALFPGAVPVRFDTAELQVAHGDVTFGSPADVTLEVGLSSTGTAMLRAAVTAILRQCFPTGAASPARCPLPDDPRVVPGSLRGTFDSSGIDDLDFAVESLASGPIRVDGTLSFHGTYRRLDENNIARTRAGRLSVQVRALTASVGPVRLRLLGASS